ncbi:hypothetical protein CRG98_046438 [Punica granatum]|uniref:WAT1-related protein n=1 Tax=Punica granatum TaxID=22663 RepID=A0A2I0HNC2_PUNGR|nr:hypothetical protein CRG98_046438 [Punica granatum]
MGKLCPSEVFNKVKPYLLMVSLQFGTAGLYIISMATLNRGMSRYVLIVYRNAVAALVISPFALVLERLNNTTDLLIPCILIPCTHTWP